MQEMIEPSDAERAEWPEATAAYVAELEAGLERAQTLLTEDVSVLRMGPSEKGFTLEAAGRMVAVIAGNLETWLREHDAENYTETEFFAGGRKYIVTVQRGEKPSPHQKRKEAEAALSEVMEWVNNWSPSFIEDDEWPATAAKVKAVLG